MPVTVMISLSPHEAAPHDAASPSSFENALQ